MAAVGIGIIWTSGWQLNVLSMGEEEAKSLGINPGRTQFMRISLATLVTAAAVSATGIIAWVGLMIPHAARLLTGPDHRRMVPFDGGYGYGAAIVDQPVMGRTKKHLHHHRL